MPYFKNNNAFVLFLTIAAKSGWICSKWCRRPACLLEKQAESLFHIPNPTGFYGNGFLKWLPVLALTVFFACQSAFSQEDGGGDPAAEEEDVVERPAGQPKMPTLPTRPGAAKENLLANNMNGERTRVLHDWWDGVDNDNNIRVAVQSVSIIQDDGRMRRTAFPPSPSFVDMNNDGLMDLVVADSFGFLWIYFNSGEPGKPEFTTGRFFPTFLGHGVKIHVCDYNQNGRYDILASGFHGDVVVIENLGTPQDPRFTRRMGIPRYVDPEAGGDRKDSFERIFIGKIPMVLGNFMAPWFEDWNGNGRPDLMLGEGTYSANSVRLVLNVGTRGRPAFVPDRVYYLAYGEGYEQLTPAIVDYNGDGLRDLLMGTRTGEIRMHKRIPGDDAKELIATITGSSAPPVLEFDGYLEIGGRKVFEPMSIIYPCDWNNNGLFDLLLGSQSGRIFVSLNRGTREEPKMDAPFPIKGKNATMDRKGPEEWSVNHGLYSSHGGAQCNSAFLLSSEESVELTAGATLTAKEGQYFTYFRYVNNYFGWVGNQEGARTIFAGRFPMVIGEKYTFTFHSALRGNAVNWRLEASESWVSRDSSGRPVYNAISHRIDDSFGPSGNWRTNRKSFRCPGQRKGETLTFVLYFRLGAGDTQLGLDDFSLTQD